MSCEKFCTCKDTNCQNHPSKHDYICTPCIEKNLRHHEIPSCFWHKIGEADQAASDYTFYRFAKKVMASEAETRIAT